METTLPMYFEQQFSGEISNVLWPLFNGEISKVHLFNGEISKVH